jgi:multiple sugar transport system substrate-binding protein
MLPPAGPAGRAVFMGGSHLAIFNSTKNPKGAELLITYLCAGVPAQLGYARTSGFLPALKAAYDDSYFTADEKRKVFKDLVQYGRIYPGVPYWGEIETSILTKRLGNLFDIAAEVHAPFSEKAVREEIGSTVREINEVIKAHFQNNPTHKELLQKAVAHSSEGN